MPKLTSITINDNINIQESRLRILHENTTLNIPNQEDGFFATRWSNGHLGNCKLDYNDSVFASFLEIFARGSGFFSMTIETDQISWSVARDKKGVYFFQFRNEVPIPRSPVPIHSWGYKVGTDRTTRIHSLYKNLPTLPQCHFLTYLQVDTIINAFRELAEFREKKTERYFDPIHWEDTGTCSPNLIGIRDAKWNEALGYRRSPKYNKYFAKKA